MKAVVTGLPIMMVESSEVVLMAVLKGSSLDSSDVNTNVSWSVRSGCFSISSSSSSGMVSNSPGVGSGNQEGCCDVCRCLAHETPILLDY